MIPEQRATSFHSSVRALSEAVGNVSGTVDLTEMVLGAGGANAAAFSFDVSQVFTNGTSEDDERNASRRSTKSPARIFFDNGYESSESDSEPETRVASGGSGQRSAILRKRSNDPR